MCSVVFCLITLWCFFGHVHSCSYSCLDVLAGWNESAKRRRRQHLQRQASRARDGDFDELGFDQKMCCGEGQASPNVIKANPVIAAAALSTLDCRIDELLSRCLITLPAMKWQTCFAKMLQPRKKRARSRAHAPHIDDKRQGEKRYGGQTAHNCDSKARSQRDL